MLRVYASYFPLTLAFINGFMLSRNGIRVYVLTDRSAWMNATYLSDSFLLIKYFYSVQWSLLYHDSHHRKRCIVSDDLDPEDDYIVKLFFDLIVSQCREATTSCKPEALEKSKLNELRQNLEVSIQGLMLSSKKSRLHKHIKICSRSGLQSQSGFKFDKSSIYLIQEDLGTPWSLVYCDSVGSYVPLEVNSIPGLETVLKRFPHFDSPFELSDEQISVCLPIFQAYLSKVVPMPVCVDLTKSILNDFIALPEYIDDSSLKFILQSIFKAGANLDWGVGHGVIEDVLIVFKILLQKTLSHHSDAELKAYDQREKLVDLLVGVLVVAVKMTGDHSFIESKAWSDKLWFLLLDNQKINKAERRMLLLNQHCLSISTSEVKDTTQWLDQQRNHYKPILASMHRFWLQPRPQAQGVVSLEFTDDATDEMPHSMSKKLDR